MTDLRIKRIAYQNFKCLRDFTLDLDGVSAEIFGGNGEGKTTLADGWFFLLFGKDSLNQSDFEIKTLTEAGEPQHNLDHSVELVLFVDGRQLTLKRTYHEVWTKPKGQAKREFSGHETIYHIDGVPAQKKEYDARIAAIADEGAFRLLTSPTYFNEQIKWTQRREILLGVCGDISDADVIASDESLADLPGILGDRSLKDHKKVVEARRSAINKELATLPARIDEATLGLSDIAGINPSSLEGDIANLRSEIEGLRAKRAQISSGGAIAAMQVQLQELEAALLRLRNEHAKKRDERLAALRESRTQTEDRVSSLRSELGELRVNRSRQGVAADAAATSRSGKLEEWERVNAEAFTHEDATSCAACGQALPSDMVQGAHDAALAKFNVEHAEHLERVIAEGVAFREARDKATAEVKRIDARIVELEPQIETAQAEVNRLKVEIEEAAAAQIDTPAYEALVAKRDALVSEIEDAEAARDNSEAIAKADAEIQGLEGSVKALEEAKAKVELHAAGQTRIEDLRTQEEAYGAELETLERQLYLADEFTRAKVALLTDRINSRFRVARFKLFNPLVNGGLEECAETTVNGVPYSSLNHGARIQVGLDIVRTLQEHYGTRAPVWCDNRESVTVIPEMDCQVISLVVSASDTVLRVESQNVKEAV